MKKVTIIIIAGAILLASCTDNTNQGPVYGTVTDVDGNVYQTVKIGTQEWMTQNLNTEHYNDGTPIPYVYATTGNQWSSLTTGAYCYYNNDTSYNSTYGKWYNWYAVNTGNLAPAGWHVATQADYETLTDYLKSIDSDAHAYGKYIIANSALWTNGGTCNDANSTGFGALPAGQVYGGTSSTTGIASSDMGTYGQFWTSTNSDSYNSRIFLVQACNVYVGGNYLSWYKYIGLPVRCVKD